MLLILANLEGKLTFENSGLSPIQLFYSKIEHVHGLIRKFPVSLWMDDDDEFNNNSGNLNI